MFSSEVIFRAAGGRESAERENACGSSALIRGPRLGYPPARDRTGRATLADVKDAVAARMERAGSGSTGGARQGPSGTRLKAGSLRPQVQRWTSGGLPPSGGVLCAIGSKL